MICITIFGDKMTEIKDLRVVRIRKNGASKALTLPQDWGQIDERVLIEVVDGHTLKIVRGALNV